MESTLKTVHAGDLWGGMTASALVLPQAMAFGITLWSPYTHNPAVAAMSGLVAAACLCAASGLLRGTDGLVSAPTGPTLMLLAGAIADLSTDGLAGSDLVTATLMIVAMAGLLQILIGGLNLGHLIKFIPYPVVSGFMTGTALLMISSQSGVVLGGGARLTMQQGGWIPLATAAVTVATMVWLPGWIRRIPAAVLGLAVGTLTFHLLIFAKEVTLPSGWVIGDLPGPGDLQSGLIYAWLHTSDFSVAHVQQWPWVLMGGSALALAVLASLDTLLTSVVADVSTGSRHQARRELMGQGAGHLFSALAGGMAGAGTTGATLVAIQSGGRQWSGLVTAGCMLLLILFLGPLAGELPISVFAGIIIYVAIFGMLDKDIMRWLRTPQARTDGVIALIVIAVTVLDDLMVAVGLGVALAVVEFIRAQVQSAVIQRRWSMHDRTSLRRRVKTECACLARFCDAVVGYDLKGTLFFGTVDHLYEAMLDDLNRASYIILDMRRVNQVDLTALRMIEHMYGIMRQRGGELILAHAPKSMGLVKKHGHRHERLIPYHDNIRLRSFANSDLALEYAENCLLKAHCDHACGGRASIELTESELFAPFNDKEQTLLAPFFKVKEVKSREFLFRSGQHNDALFVILSGDVELLLPYGRKKRLRLATFGPGMAVGEISFLEPGECDTDARAMGDCRIAMIRHAALKRLCKQHAGIGMRLLMRLGHDLSRELHMADTELRRLAS